MSKIAVCQVELQVGDLAGNRKAVDGAIDEAVRGGAELVVVPELSDSGYVFDDRAEAASLAASVAESATLEQWRALAGEHDVVIVGGFCEQGADGNLYNSAALVDHSGVRGVYRKAHLWNRETLVFTPGDLPAPVLDTAIGRVGVMICYDAEFPEWVRMAALDGAELLAVPTNEPFARRPRGERPVEFAKAQAGAAANAVYVALADRCGVERGVSWAGVTSVIGPDGYPLAGPALDGVPHVLFAEVDLSRAKDKRLGDHNDAFGDLRPELYR